ncbi:MAG TPA: thioredoxin family protein [Polyangiaceae bacterium]|nr:thioredoxin family protein [Polyangiaceae bacterium]
MKKHTVVSHAEWLEARTKLLVKEKEFTRLRDRLSQERRDLPWERVDKPYSFEGVAGTRSLSQLFEQRSQLVVYHAMFAPEAAAACPQCSSWMDNFQGPLAHLNHHDVTLVAVSRAPFAKIAAYGKRMGWKHPWYSSGGSSFNYDFCVSFTPEDVKAGRAVYNYKQQDPDDMDREGVSVFFKDEQGAIFHTYSAYARGIDMLNLTYHYLDISPRGRDEAETGPNWVRRHDEYEG